MLLKFLCDTVYGEFITGTVLFGLKVAPEHMLHH